MNKEKRFKQGNVHESQNGEKLKAWGINWNPVTQKNQRKVRNYKDQTKISYKEVMKPEVVEWKENNIVQSFMKNN